MVRVLKCHYRGAEFELWSTSFVVSNDGLVFIKPTDIIIAASFLVDIFEAVSPLAGETVIRFDVLQTD